MILTPVAEVVEAMDVGAANLLQGIDRSGNEDVRILVEDFNAALVGWAEASAGENAAFPDTQVAGDLARRSTIGSRSASGLSQSRGKWM